jgi:hypothetical protein
MYQCVKKLIMMLLLAVVVQSTPVPTSQPTFGVLAGQYCSAKAQCLKGVCVGPWITVSNEILGVCTGVVGCRRACVHDPEGGSGCKFFPGNCLKCKRGYKLKKGRCKRRNGA